MLAILAGRRANRFAIASGDRRPDSARPLDRLPESLDQMTSGGLLDVREARPSRPKSRRRYRSRNCRTFRQLGPYFQFTSAEIDDHEARRRQQLMDAHSRVQQLLEQRDLVESRRVNAHMYAVSHATDIARRFYELFMHGFDPVNRPVQSHRAEAFLRAAMRDDVLCTEFSGVDMFLTQYRMGTENHASMTLQLQRLTLLDASGGDGEDGEDAIQIKAEATARFRISRVTLERLFPSLIQDEALTQRLIGREYEMQYDKVFHFRRSDGRIFQHESRIDLCSGLLDLVGDPFLALRLVEASVMTKHGHWRVADEVAEDRHELAHALL